MSLEAPDHSDVRALRDALPRDARFLYGVIADRYEFCDVEVHALRGGTLDPLAFAVLETLRTTGIRTVDDLCAHLGLTDEASVRIVAEAVHVLIRAQTLSVRGGELAFHEHLWQPTQLLSAREQILFLPPAARRVRWSSHAYKGSLHAKGLAQYRKDNPDVRLFTPDWHSLYTDAGLEEGIRQSYARHWRIGSLRANGVINQHEILQRSRMQIREDRLFAASVKRHEPKRRYVLHRAYMYTASVPGGIEWVVLIKRYDLHKTAHDYTERLRRAFKKSPELVNQFRAQLRDLP